MRTAKLMALLLGLLALAPSLCAHAQTSPADEAQSSAPGQNGAAERDAAPGATLQAFAGAGVGTRGFERPLGAQVQRLANPAFFAAEAGLRLALFPEEAFSLACLARYQTSLGLALQQLPPFALPNDVHVRAERIELSVAPTFTLGSTPVPLALSLPVGFGMRMFLADLHNLNIPSYSLLGPSLRAELSARFGSRLSLRLGPEVQWVFVAGQSVRRNGVGSQGMAVGGELTAAVKVVSFFQLELAYRESHAFVGSEGGRPDFSDVERFAILRAAGSL